MKKNLRIVSAAAAALLAVAPVAATAIATPATTVSAATDYNDQIGELGMATDLGTIKVANVQDQSAVKKLIQSQVAKQLNVPDAAITITSYDLKGTATDPKATVTFTVSSAKAKKDNWKADVTVNGKVVNGLQWRENLNGSSDGQLYAAGATTKPAVYSVDLVQAAKTPADTSSPNFNFGNSSVFDADVNTGVNITAGAGWDGNNKLQGYGSFSGNITATVGGQNYTALLHTTATNGVNVSVKDPDGNALKSAHDLHTRTLYRATISGVTFNLGNSNAGKSVTLTLPHSARFVPTDAQKNEVTNNGRTFTANADTNGVLTVPTIEAKFYALDPTDMKGLNFYSVKTGEQVQNGSVTLHAVNGQGNVESVYTALNQEYKATQVFNDKHEGHAENEVRAVLPINDIRDQLKKQNIDVDANGYFKAQSSISLTLNAKSPYNGATASLPVTVNFDNATAATTNETTKNVTIMHISTIYDKNGKATHEPALRAYDTYSVVATPVNLKDEKGKDAGMFYKLAGKDQYIKVGNVDGTKRSLKKNSYVYKSTGKAYMKSKKHHRVLKAGSSVTTYGKSFMIAGHQMYRIGKNQYVKKANF